MSYINVILIALVAGGATTDKVVQDAYKVLKARIQSKLMVKSRAELVLNKFERDPETWEQPLRIMLTEVEADKNEEVIKAALALIVLVDPEEVATHKYQLHTLLTVYRNFIETREQYSISGQRSWDDQAQLDRELVDQLSRGQPELQKRWINTEFLGHDMTKPLQLSNIYTISFNVDTTQHDAAVSTEFDQSHLFRSTAKEVKLTVYLSSKDFIVYTQEPQVLVVPRTGKSRNMARFDIEPQSVGVGEINVAFFKDNNFIQGMMFKVAVEDPRGKTIISAENLGRPVDGAFAVRPRDISLVIRNTGTGFSLTAVGAVVTEATLPITLPQLNKMIDKVRKALQDVVQMRAKPGNILVYQRGIDIPPEINQQALQRLARAGFELYQGIFYSESADAQTNLLGDRLRELSQKETLKIQIVSQQFLLPWGLIYMSDSYDQDHIDPELFLGFKHIIEHIPLQQSMQVLDNEINSYPILNVSLNVNADIDRQMNLTVIADQLAYWQRVCQSGDVQMIIRSDGNNVLQAFINDTLPYQILYFYCHAVSQHLDNENGPDASYMGLSNGTRLILGELKTRAPIRKVLAGTPLLFLNACESAEMSPLFYGGFMPYFIAKGARGMIGTECDIPALFAATWAERFFNPFLRGQKSLGEIFLDLRREFFYKHNNLLGLLYALYCDADTRIVPGLLTGL